MVTLLRRVFWLAVLGSAGYAVYTAWQRKNEPVPDGPPVWPPLDTTPPPTQPAGDETVVTSDAPVERDAWSTSGEQRWTPPVEGQCPPDHLIKGKASSGIYHVPGGRFYDRTVPDRCYATEDDAIADGYRRAKA